MKKIALSLPLLALVATSHAFVSTPFEAFDNATVRPTGPRTGSSGRAFMNIEGSANGDFASFGVADFDGSMIDFGGNQVDVITGITITLTQSNAGFTLDGPLSFFVTSNLRSIADGADIIYDFPNGGENGIGDQLNPIEFLGSGTFTEVATGEVDEYTFNSLSAGASAMLTAMYLGDSNVRIVIAPDDPTTAATYAGYSNTNPLLIGPQLTLTGEAVPEPASMVALGLGALALVRRRRNRA
ncbi:MAG: PEP-CTERM sorting domain-containing protein [Fimbriimonadaceae bacterium]|nr:PEP-CTERM sorting domain-containing protein [Fimbriimonadaceae bacterium]